MRIWSDLAIQVDTSIGAVEAHASRISFSRFRNLRLLGQAPEFLPSCRWTRRGDSGNRTPGFPGERRQSITSWRWLSRRAIGRRKHSRSIQDSVTRLPAQLACAAEKTGESMKYLFAAVFGRRHLRRLQRRERRGRMRPRLASWPYGGCQPNRSAVVVAPRYVRPPVVVVRPGPRCPYGTVWRPRPLPRLLSVVPRTDEKSPARAGLLFVERRISAAGSDSGGHAALTSSATTPIVTTPMATAASTAMAPTPAPAPPAPVPTTPAPVPVPVHFLRLETIDFIARGDGRLGIRGGREPPVPGRLAAAPAAGLSTGGECRRAAAAPNAIFKNSRRSTDIFPRAGVMQGKFRCGEMNGR